jgi:hypothetical protein
MNKWIIYLNLGIPIFAEFILEWHRIVLPTDSYRSIAIWTYWIYLPIVLTIVNLLLFFLRIDNSFLRCAIFMFLGLSLALIIGYLRWAISSKTLFHLAAGTIMGTTKLLIYYICFAVTFFLICKGGQLLLKLIRK